MTDQNTYGGDALITGRKCVISGYFLNSTSIPKTIIDINPSVYLYLYLYIHIYVRYYINIGVHKYTGCSVWHSVKCGAPHLPVAQQHASFVDHSTDPY